VLPEDLAWRWKEFELADKKRRYRRCDDDRNREYGNDKDYLRHSAFRGHLLSVPSAIKVGLLQQDRQNGLARCASLCNIQNQLFDTPETGNLWNHSEPTKDGFTREMS